MRIVSALGAVLLASSGAAVAHANSVDYTGSILALSGMPPGLKSGNTFTADFSYDPADGSTNTVNGPGGSFTTFAGPIDISFKSGAYDMSFVAEDGMNEQFSERSYFPPGSLEGTSSGGSNADYSLQLSNSVVTNIAGMSGPPSLSGELTGPGFTATLSNMASATPEPSTWALMVLGIGGVGLFLRQARRKHGLRFKEAFVA